LAGVIQFRTSFLDQEKSMNVCIGRYFNHAAVNVYLILLSAVFSVAATPVVRADDAHRNKVYDSNGFEPRPFTAGETLVGLDGWISVIVPGVVNLNPDAALVTRSDSRNGRQSIEVRGADLEPSLVTAPYDAVGSYRQPVNYAVTPKKPIVVVEADLLLETDEAATEDDFFSLTIAARSGDGETLGEMGLSSSGLAVAYHPNAQPGDEAEFTSPVQFNTWHRVSIVLDFLGETTTVLYFLDDELLGIEDTESSATVLSRGSMIVYALPDGRNDTRANYTARFDNFRISVHGAGE